MAYLNDPENILGIAVEDGPLKGFWLRQEVDMTRRAFTPVGKRMQEMVLGASRTGSEFKPTVATPETWGRLLLMVIAGAPGMKVHL